MLREAINEFKVTGVLSEIDLKYGTYMKAGVNTEYVGGSIKVLVSETTANGTLHNMEIPIHMFSNKYTKTGSVSPAYEAIERVMKEYVSIAACGDEAHADRVMVVGSKNTRITMNDFVGRDGNIVSDPRLTASFVSKVTGPFEPEATFSLECMLNNMHRVTDADGVEVDPAKLELQVIVPMYGGKVQVMKLHVTNPAAISHIESNWESGKTYQVNGRLNFDAKTVETLQEVAFGDPIKKSHTVSVKEFIISSGSDAYDDDLAFNIGEIQAAVAQRKADLEAKKNQAKAAPAPAAAPGKAGLDLGF